MLPQSSLYYFNVSKLSHYEFCPIRSKIEILNRDRNFTTINKAMRVGTRLHELYSMPNKSFNRVLVRARLLKYSKYTGYGHRVFYKELPTKDYIIKIGGMYDDLRIVKYGDKRYTVLVEVKTTSKKYIWSHEVRTAVKQLQLYMWLLKDLLESVKFPLWERGYVEIYSQKTGNLIKAIPVKYDYNIENWIKYVTESFMGLRPIRIPDFKLCKFCTPNCKKVCSWYAIRKSMK